MTNFIQKTHLDISFIAFNCSLDSQSSLLTSQILVSCSKFKWSNRAYAVYWLRGTLLYPWWLSSAISLKGSIHWNLWPHSALHAQHYTLANQQHQVCTRKLGFRSNLAGYFWEKNSPENPFSLATIVAHVSWQDKSTSLGQLWKYTRKQDVQIAESEEKMYSKL